MQCNNNNNDKDFFFRGELGNHFGKYLKALFELYEYHYHRNVIIKVELIKLENVAIYHSILIIS